MWFRLYAESEEWKKRTNKTKTDSRIQRTNWWPPEGRGLGRARKTQSVFTKKTNQQITGEIVYFEDNIAKPLSEKWLFSLHRHYLCTSMQKSKGIDFSNIDSQVTVQKNEKAPACRGKIAGKINHSCARGDHIGEERKVRKIYVLKLLIQTWYPNANCI